MAATAPTLPRPHGTTAPEALTAPETAREPEAGAPGHPADLIRPGRKKSRGLTAAELLELGCITAGYTSPLSAVGLQGWLLAERLAEVDADGRLWPTRRGTALGSALGFPG